MLVHVGCCGFAISRKKYYQEYDVVELQDTFYNPPDETKLRKLRAEAPDDFIFTMKAWQAITHPPSSATWRRCKVKIPKEQWDKYGFLRPTKENFDAWELIAKGAKAINARVVIIQTPPSFGYSEENYRNVIDFFSSITPTDFIIGWEPRGTWKERPDKVREIVEMFRELVHITDPLRVLPATLKEISYFRLHGIGGKEVNYRYKYTDEDLTKLKSILNQLESKEAYVMFNNIYMASDAKRFKEILTKA
ncbi:MAG: DUF72 domain-containing protein [Desulfurococcales archaeon]|nr:DUF72 domain-containing protein [Desulfurococcales archaeon]